jgi:hypothetical protein
MEKWIQTVIEMGEQRFLGRSNTIAVKRYQETTAEFKQSLRDTFLASDSTKAPDCYKAYLDRVFSSASQK